MCVRVYVLMTLMPPRGGFGDVLFPSAKEVVLGLPLISTAHDVQRVVEVKMCKSSRAELGVSDESSSAENVRRRVAARYSFT